MDRAGYVDFGGYGDNRQQNQLNSNLTSARLTPLAELLRAQLPDQRCEIVDLTDYQLHDDAKDSFSKLLGRCKGVSDRADQAVVLLSDPHNLSLYQNATTFLSENLSSTRNIYGLFVSEEGAVRLHQVGTASFIGFHDLRDDGGGTTVLEHRPDATMEGYGYEFSSTQFHLNLLKDPSALLKARTWREYLPVLPLQKVAMHIGESSTPVFPIEVAVGIEKPARRTIYVKDESRNFTGSFKDRQTFVLINKAIEDGCREVTVNSSGNAAISAAAYARRAGIKCTVVVPQTTSESKKQLIKAFGADVVERSGNYEENHRHLLSNESNARNITPGATCLGLDGIKLIAYELTSQGIFPNVLIAPSGNGSLIAGLHKGFKELLELGFIKSIPKLVSVQIQGAAPLLLALKEKRHFMKAADIPDSAAEAIIAEESFSSPLAVQALRESGGNVVEITDDELTRWQKKLLEGCCVVSEFSSAAAFAALDHLTFREDDVIAVINTASGYKDLRELLTQIQG